MRIQTFGPQDPAWTDALTRLPHDVYHTAAYVATEGRRLQAKPAAILVTSGERQLFLPYLVRVCDPQLADSQSVTDVVSPYGYPGLLLSDAGRDPEFASMAWSAVLDEWKKTGVCTAFLRMHPILSTGIAELLPAAQLVETGLTVGVDLHQEEEALWKGIGHNHRRTLDRCQKQGFAARFVPLQEYLGPYRTVYNQTMDRVKAAEAYYFDEAYFTELSRQPNVHCCIVEEGEAIAATCLFFESHGIVQAHLGGSADDYYRRSPFHLCLYHAMLWARSRGNRWFHLGGGVGGENDPLFQFKAGFSETRFKYSTARLVLNKPLYLELVEAAARIQGSSSAELFASNYFPAYRSAPLEKV